MKVFMDILLLLGGVGIFLSGMGQMSSGMKKSAGEGVRKLFNKIGGNRVIGYGVGVGATAIIQSSSATSIMTIGLANAHIVNTRQGAPIILGAKVGTTVTGFIIALSGLSKGDFSMSILFASMAFVGAIMLMIVQKDKYKNIATLIMGFGMLFLGLEVMGAAIGNSESELKSMIADMFAQPVFKNPVLLVLIGLVFTAIIQSSSAATGIFITFLASGIIRVDQSFFLVMGANIGTCSDGLMASIGGSTDGKRLAVFHLLTSTFGAVLFTIITVIFRQPITNLFVNVIKRENWFLPIFTLSYNLIYTLLLLPFLPYLVRFMERLIKDKKEKPTTVLEYINPQLMQNSILAVGQIKREIISMGKRAAANLELAFNALMTGNASDSATVLKQEDTLNALNREISNYLIRLSSISSSLAEETAIGTYHHVINDIERIGDHAKNFMSIAEELANEKDSFTLDSCDELKSMYEKVHSSLLLSLEIFESGNKRLLPQISANEKEIDGLQKSFSKGHFKRLNAQSGWAEIQIYYDIITELERVGDHIVNIAFSVVNPTGTESYDTGTKTQRPKKSEDKKSEQKNPI